MTAMYQQQDPHSADSTSYFGGLYNIAAAGAYKKAIGSIVEDSDILSQNTIVALTMANTMIMSLLNQYIEQKNKKLQYWTDKIDSLKKSNGKISKDDTNTLQAYQIDYNEASSAYQPFEDTLNATTSSFTTTSQTLATDFKNFIQVLATLVQLQTYVSQKV